MNPDQGPDVIGTHLYNLRGEVGKEGGTVVESRVGMINQREADLYAQLVLELLGARLQKPLFRVNVVCSEVGGVF